MTNEIRNVRNTFRKEYSSEAFKVINYVARGWDTSRIAEKLDIPATSVATYKGNLTRGCYSPYAEVSNGSVTGSMF